MSLSASGARRGVPVQSRAGFPALGHGKMCAFDVDAGRFAVEAQHIHPDEIGLAHEVGDKFRLGERVDFARRPDLLNRPSFMITTRSEMAIASPGRE